MAGWGESAVEFIKWIRDSNRPAWVFLIVTGAVLLLPDSWLTTLGMATWVANYKPWMVILCAVSLVWLGTSPFVVWHRHYKIKERIKHSGRDEQSVLARFIRTNSVVECFGWSEAPHTSSLIQDKILFDTGSRDGAGNPYISMDPWVFQYLRKHKQNVGINEKKQST
jgi:hypothetical protein